LLLDGIAENKLGTHLFRLVVVVVFGQIILMMILLVIETGGVL
jgi:hypothetical protein